MGTVVLATVPDVLRKAGVPVRLWPGWETRSRSSGGFIDLRGIGHHHDAITEGVSEDARSRSGWDRETNLNRPVGNARVHKDGLWVIGAVMATNTQGRGPSLRMSRGVVPENMANHYFFSLEPSNNGIGEVWPDAQVQSIITGSAALMLAYGLKPGDNMAHFETAPGRKIDPFGNSLITGRRNVMWPMDKLRGEIWLRSLWLIEQGLAWGSPPRPTPVAPSTSTYTVVSGDTLYGIARKTGVNITELLGLNRLTLNSVIHPGQVLSLKPAPAPAPMPPFNPERGQFSLWPIAPNKPTLRIGSARRDATRYVQGVIQFKAGGRCVVDGVFGPQTKARVEDVQRWWNSVSRHKAAVDGVVGMQQTYPILDWLAGT